MIGKKGMGIGQVFIFIIAAITFALIMIFGFQTISSFISSGEQVEFIQFKTDLENSIKKIYTEYGAVRIETFSASKFDQICFVDMDYQPTAGDEEMEQLCAKDALACDVWEDAQEAMVNEKSGYGSVDQNVFLKPSSQSIKVYKISIGENEEGTKGFLCKTIRGGTFSLMLEGKGSKTQISDAPTSSEE